MKKVALALAVLVGVVALQWTAIGKSDVVTISSPPPTITTVTLTGPNSTCGTEVSEVNVQWTATPDRDTTFTKFKVTVKGVFPPGNTQAPQTQTKEVPGSARNAKLCFFNGHQFATYEATLESTVSQILTTQKNGSF